MDPVEESLFNQPWEDAWMFLLSACGLAFLAVFVLLSGLAGLMQLITFLFPERKDSADPALIAAISSAVAVQFPGAQVTSIEERS